MSKRKATKKATRKPAKEKAPKSTKKGPVPPEPLWGASVKVGSVGHREFLIREPLNQAAVNSLTDDQVQALVLSVLLRRMEVDMNEVKRLLGALKVWAGNEALIAGA